MTEADSPRPAKLFVAAPTHTGDVRIEWALSLLDAINDLSSRGVAVAVNAHSGESLVQRARNVQVAQFLRSDCTHYLTWDTDEAIRPVQVIAEMIALGLDVVGLPVALKRHHWDEILWAAQNVNGITPQALQRYGKRFAFHPLDGESLHVDARGVAEVRVCGTGAMLVRREVFERMIESPEVKWFKSPREPAGEADLPLGHPIPIVFDAYLRDDGVYLSEDYGFCDLWQRLGGKSHLYLAGEVLHVGRAEYVGDVTKLFEAASANQNGDELVTLEVA